MLNLMILAYRGQPAEEIMQPSSLSARQQEVLNDYVQRRLRRRCAGARYTPAQALRWLAWLAQQMQEHNQTTFYLERMQPDWLAGSQRASYRGSKWQIVRLGAQVGVSVVMLVVWLVWGLWGLVGVRDSVRVNVRAKKIRPVEVLTWSWEQALSRRVLGLILGLVVVLVGRLVGELVVGLIVGLLVALTTAALLFGRGRSGLSHLFEYHWSRKCR